MIKWKALLLFIFYFSTNTLAQQTSLTDSAIKSIAKNNVPDSNFIFSCFYIADTYMDIGQYDSAQLWLNKLYEKLPIKAITRSNYYLISRQAEVYYYNNLQELGLQQSRRGLDMAKALNDSLLLADSYNFLGLFYTNMDSSEKAIPYFKEGIKYVTQPTAANINLNLSKPHHLYGNLSEAFFKIMKYDSALLTANISLQKAKEINSQRGVAVAFISIADVFIALHKSDSALHYYKKGLLVAQNENEDDVALISHCGLAKAFVIKNYINESNKQLNAGFTLLQQNPSINRFFALQFLSNAIVIYRNSKNNEGLNTALQLKSEIETNNLKSSNTQIQTILNASVANEKRLLSLELTDAQQKQKLASSRLIMALILFSLFGIAFLVYRYYFNQRLAVAAIRNKISQDLHDDVGASLSSLQVYSAVASQHLANNPDKTRELLDKIATEVTSLMENIGDMVWSMKQGKEQIVNFDAKIKNYVADVFAAMNINYSVDVDAEIDTLIKNSTAKRNILMTVKEAINNVVKYSNATEVTIIVKKIGNAITIAITDNGKGFDMNATEQSGNGLLNIKNRIAEINGTVQIESVVNRGTKILALVPLDAVSNVGW